ncbi:hypothetical protein Y032_0221g2569 [Ancylostoma ceylanicum]|uniref:Uncharacterized protein n=2 Tax=Ancylostoma ceylanicum TaxID=53326 RepID=A0A016SI85_9BILA|nr:hypothetical protein Y032_0221g2569 [Ancylostoma ceylanicum]
MSELIVKKRQHVTFACPSSATKQQLRKSKSDHRKRQTNQQNGKEKKAKYSEQTAQLQQCEEILAEVEHGCKTIEEKVRADRNLASEALNEMGELVCQYAEIDNKLNTLEDNISNLENSAAVNFDEAEFEELVKKVEQNVLKYEEFDAFLSELADRMGDASERGDCTQLFYDALPTVERMLADLSV